MKTHIVTALMTTLGLALMAAQAHAIPSWKTVQPTFYQSGQGTLAAGLVVQAETSLPMLGVGGGFTIQCNMSSLSIVATEKGAEYDFLTGAEVTVNVPVPTPGTYTAPGWTSITVGTCNGQCTMQWKAEAVDSSAQFNVGTAGAGVSFHLLPMGGIERGNTVVTHVCRRGTPQCCTPGCSIP